METELKKLKEIRELLVKEKQIRDVILEQAKKDPIFQRVEDLENTKQELELLIREQAVKIYQETGEKKIGQIGIRIMQILNYDQEEALKWAKEHGLCLNLDKKNFEKLAKTQDIEFVDKSEKATATIPVNIK